MSTYNVQTSSTSQIEPSYLTDREQAFKDKQTTTTHLHCTPCRQVHECLYFPAIGGLAHPYERTDRASRVSDDHFYNKPQLICQVFVNDLQVFGIRIQRFRDTSGFMISSGSFLSPISYLGNTLKTHRRSYLNEWIGSLFARGFWCRLSLCLYLE